MMPHSLWTDRMANPSTPPPPDDGADAGLHEAARREKLRKIAALGHDPWGGRFDGRTLLGEIRARKTEIRYKKEAGDLIEPPDREANPSVDFRQWVADHLEAFRERPASQESDTP